MILVRSSQPQTTYPFLSPWGLCRHLWQHRELIWQFVRREVKTRYHGSILGPLWSWVMPLMALLIYTFVFGSVLKPRGPGWGERTSWQLAMVLISGLLLFNSFSELVGRAPFLIFSQPQFVKKVVFPVEILPLSMLLGMLFHLLISLSVVVLLQTWQQVSFYWTWLWLLVLFVPYAMFLLGVGWFLASTSVFLRDVVPTMTAFCQLLIFLTPVFYPLSAVPEPYQIWLMLNPLCWVVELGRAALLGQTPSMKGMLFLFAMAWLVMQSGYWWFMLLKPRFADVV